MTKLGAIVTTPNQSPLAVITVTYSPGEYLGSFLDSLPGACARGTKVVLADNGSTDGVPEADGEAVASAEAEGSAVPEDESSSLEQVMAVEEPTPRGSKPMMS
mgnify:CR=1 FL=1